MWCCWPFPKAYLLEVMPTPTYCIFVWFKGLTVSRILNLFPVVEGCSAIICLSGPGLIWQRIYAPSWWQYMLSAWHTESNGVVWSGSTSWKVVFLSSTRSAKLPPVPVATLKGHPTDYLPIHVKNQWDHPSIIMSFTHHKRVCAVCSYNWELLVLHFSRTLAHLRPVWSLLSEIDPHD